jgi:acyl-CoA synthetase (AMP-forming)/AMP-acid ligase II
VQVDGIKPVLKAPMVSLNPKYMVSERLQLQYDKLLSNSAFIFNLRQFTEEVEDAKGGTQGGGAAQKPAKKKAPSTKAAAAEEEEEAVAAAAAAGAYTRPLFSST